MAEINFSPGAALSAWSSAAQSLSPRALDGTTGVNIEFRADVEIASLMIGKASRSEAAARLKNDLGLALPEIGRISEAGNLVALGTAPMHWTVLQSEPRVTPLARSLSDVAGHSVFVADQSCGRAVVRLSGKDVAKLLTKGCPIDLHPGVFQAGHAASTLIEHLPVQIWRMNQAEIYDFMVARSYAEDFAYWLSVSAAEFGYSVSAQAGR